MIAASVKFQSLPYSNEIVKLRRKKEEEGNGAEEEGADPVSPHQLVVVVEVAELV